jgi:Family of unknown function (DUF5995)
MAISTTGMPRRQNFSNPAVNFVGTAMPSGTADRNGTLALDNTRLAVSNFRIGAKAEGDYNGDGNAHINRDLPDGIVQSFLALGGDPITDNVREKDFDSVYDILERVEQDVKTEFTSGLVGDIDRLGGPMDDAVAMWKVRSARSAAWTNAQVLWELRGLPRLHDRFFSKLDSLVGMTGRGLLLPRDRVSVR